MSYGRKQVTYLPQTVAPIEANTTWVDTNAPTRLRWENTSLIPILPSSTTQYGIPYISDTNSNVLLNSASILTNTTGRHLFINEGYLSLGAVGLNGDGQIKGVIKMNGNNVFFIKGNRNIFVGPQSGGNDATGYAQITGSFNHAFGDGALRNITSGTNNTCIGLSAGQSYTTETNNIIIGALSGVAGDSGTLRIGSTNRAFIGGISSSAVIGSTVRVNASTGQLGVTPSASKYKENVTPLSKSECSRIIQGLNPVTFNYIESIDSARSEQCGLIAEEVKDLCPNLVTYDGDGNLFSVAYEHIPMLLLKEIQSLREEINLLKS